METPYETQIRNGLRVYLARVGHGAVTRLSESTGLTRPTIRKLRDEGGSDSTTLGKVAHFLEEEGYLDKAAGMSEKAVQDTERWNKTLDEFRGFVSNRPTTILSTRLRALADTLDSDDFAAVHKAEEFVTFIEGCHKRIDAYVEAIKKSENGES